MTNSIIFISRSPPRFMRNVYLDSAVLVRRTECKRPCLNELEHFIAHILVRGVLDELGVSFAVRLVGDFFVDWRSAVLDSRFENHESI